MLQDSLVLAYLCASARGCCSESYTQHEACCAGGRCLPAPVRPGAGCKPGRGVRPRAQRLAGAGPGRPGCQRRRPQVPVRLGRAGPAAAGLLTAVSGLRACWAWRSCRAWHLAHAWRVHVSSACRLVAMPPLRRGPPSQACRAWPATGARTPRRLGVLGTWTIGDRPPGKLHTQAHLLHVHR